MNPNIQPSLPEIACQQVLQNDASVFSIQWLDMPEEHARHLTPSLLLERYLETIRNSTLAVVRPVMSSEGLQFRLFTSPLALLSFGPPQHQNDDRRQEVRLPIKAGLAVQPKRRDNGAFSFRTERRGGAFRATVELSDFFPLLLGGTNPSLLHKLVYRFSQAYIHKVVTVRFLSRLHRDLTGVAAAVPVTEVKIREGLRT